MGSKDLNEGRCHGRILAALALLAIVAYIPVFHQPLLEDDYPNITLALSLGTPESLGQMATTVFRFRATSLWLMNAAYHLFGLAPPAYYGIGILLHVLNTWLMYALGRWRPLGYETAAWAAGFFAVYEGHQEAVMWFSACNELLQFLFGVAALVCWLHFLFGERWRGLWYAAAILNFALALLSKESAVVFGALFLLPLLFEKTGRRALSALPFLALAGASAYSTFASRSNSFRFQDGSFSLHAPVWQIWPQNLVRLFWFWGLVAVIAGAVWGWRERKRAVVLGLAWAGIALIPYSFLLYSQRIPSRQLYLASAGVAWIVAAGVLTSLERFRVSRRPVIAVVCAAILLHNVGYLWVRKRRQFLERAQPTEELIALARRTRGPILIRCFPRSHLVAEEAVHLAAGRPVSDVIWDEREARARGATVVFCYGR